MNTHAKQPNSFVHRFVPKDRKDLLKGGEVQALQVISRRTGTPIVFHAGQADADTAPTTSRTCTATTRCSTAAG